MKRVGGWEGGERKRVLLLSNMSIHVKVHI